MFLDPNRFDFLGDLRACGREAKSELATLAHDDFVPWPQAAAYEGDWRLFALWLHQPPSDFRADYARNRARCPRTVRLLEQMGRIHSACFSWLGPSTHIFTHTDAYYPGLIRAHVGVIIPPQSLVRIGAERRELTLDDIYVLDGQIEHEVANLSTTPRITLLVDIAMSEREEAYVMGVSPRRRSAQALLDHRKQRSEPRS